MAKKRTGTTPQKNGAQVRRPGRRRHAKCRRVSDGFARTTGRSRRRRGAGVVSRAVRGDAGTARRVAHRPRRANAVSTRSLGAPRQAADERDRDARPLSRSDHRDPRTRPVLDAERKSPPAGDAKARRTDGCCAARPRSQRCLQDPGAQHRESTQPEREIARDDSHAARAGGEW